MKGNFPAVALLIRFVGVRMFRKRGGGLATIGLRLGGGF
jgi:hypothetical protein